jgi:hypothetical protein
LADAKQSTGAAATRASRVAQAQTAGTNAADHQTKLAAARNELRDYLPGGPRYQEARTAADSLRGLTTEMETLVRRINDGIETIFESVNALHRRSETTDEPPFELFLGQFMKNSYVEFKLREVPGFTPYAFNTRVNAPTAAPGQEKGGGTQPAGEGRSRPEGPVDLAALAAEKGGGTGIAKDAQCPAATCCCCGACPEKEKKEEAPPKPPEGKVIATRAFTVHQFARANVTSGFIISALRNRQYGVEQVRALDDAGAPRSDKDGGPIFDRAAFVGEAKRPQTHYYVGLQYYFRERDLFPGADDGWHPGLLVGYGINDPFNFFFGVNLETPWGLNFGGGWHIGREKFLAAGVVTRENANENPLIPVPERTLYTRLAADVKEPPTVDRRRLDGFYFNIGFDLRVFKSVFGQATAGAAPAKP